MKRWVLLSCALFVALTFSGTALAESKHGLQLYTATVDAATAERLSREGYDVAAVRAGFAAVQVDLVLAPASGRSSLARASSSRSRGTSRAEARYSGRSSRPRVDFSVYRSFDEPGGIRDELYAIARRNPQLVKLEVLGKSIQGREYIALKVTQGALFRRDGRRPAVLYVSTHHAREWISTEVNRRLLHWYIDQWRANNHEIRDLLRETELWFVLVHNPDGYQYTFDVERLWRKNLRDNDANGTIDTNDGVDPNRNYPEHWNYDDEGSSSQFSSDELPRCRPCFRAGDTGSHGAHEPGPVPVRDQLPLVRPAPALRAGVAGADALGRRPDLRRHSRARMTTRPSRASTPASEPTCTRRTGSSRTSRTESRACWPGRPS